MTEAGKRDARTEVASEASAVASRILAQADRDIAFVIQLVGESQYLLVSHFVTFIEVELGKEGVAYGDHPLLRPFIETHARELAGFVMNGIALRHQIGMKAFERLAGDPLRLLRADLWDSFRSLIEDAEQNFVQGTSGLRAIVAEVARLRPSSRTGRPNA